MRLSPAESKTSPVTPSHAEEEATARGDAKSGNWRWAVIHFPCLEPVTPEGHIVVVSDKRHLAEARRRFPDLVLWHEKELGLFGELMDDCHLDEEIFAKVTFLKLKTRGWFLGVEGTEVAVSGHTAKA